ncbi:MAG: isoprenylcysteine carboxylmethyltransferase family protein [Desulforhabdus sp.]|jgi:protein-S-isoprenylcysteine O-methyltransferase Ste14|nr:isoprenylcysteine carboxylmethyltransferase family protein [Desulforhabdus sp.]
MNPDNGGSRNPYKISGGSFVGRSLAAALFLALILFLPAGDLFWTRGWLFLFVSVVTLGAAAFYLWRVNPEIFSARRRIQPGTKRWDRILLGFLFLAFLAVFVVAGYDDGRFARSDLPRWSIGCGYLLYVAGIVLTTWAEAVNRFFEPGVRIQTERGHRVIDTGPYATVRHPGYVAACLLITGIALSLGSLWALVPAGLASGLLVLRTVWEDRTLRQELPGYQEYTQRVRFRLIPGVW